jgi:hypothetical protein
MDESAAFITLTKLINEERQYNSETTGVQNHRTHCYKYFGSCYQQGISNYHIKK